MEQSAKNRALRRVMSYWLVGAGLTLSYLSLRGSAWQGSIQLHTLMEALATVLALTIGGMALVRYYSRKDSAFLIIGAAFLGTGLLDGYHALVTSAWMAAYLPSDLTSLIPWSWVASRLLLSVILFISWLEWRREQRLGSAGRVTERAVYLRTAAATLLSFLFFALAPLPRAYYPELPFHRPEEFVPALFFLLALIGYLQKGRWRDDAFEHWLVLCLVVSLVSQAVFMSFSGQLFDMNFDMAHMLKKASYLCVLTGLFIAMYGSFRSLELKHGAERRRAAQTLRRTEIQYLTVLNAMADGLVTIDEQCRIKLLNPAAEEIFGYFTDEMQGKPFGSLMLEEYQQRFEACIARFLSDPDSAELPLGCELECRRRDGEVFPLELSVSEMRIGDHSLFSCIVRDITQRRQMEMELRLAASTFDAHEAILITDRDANILRINPAFTELTGYAADEVVGCTPRLLQSGRHDKAFYEGMWESLLQRGQWEGEIWNRYKGGEIQPEWMTITAVMDDSGVVTHYVSVRRNIFELKQQQLRLEHLAVEEQLLGELMRLSLHSLDMDEFLRRGLKELFEAVPWLDLVPKAGLFLAEQQDRSEMLRLVAGYNLEPEIYHYCGQVPYGKCICGRTASSGEVLCAASNDPRHDIHIPGMDHHLHYCIPILASEVVIGVLTLFLPEGHERTPWQEEFLRRVTAVLSMGITRRYANAALVRAKESAEMANQAKSEFLANMSHELRTPMHAILSFANMGVEKAEAAPREGLQRYFLRISESGQRLMRLLNDLLDLSKLEAGGVEFNKASHDLREIVETAAAEFQALLRERALFLEVVPPEVDTVAVFDGDRLLQVVRNLLSNAIKFSPEGKTIRISFAAAQLSIGPKWEGREKVPAIAVSVADQGVGVPEGELEAVFDKFVQSSKTKTGAGGTGLGLAICKEIVEGHQGRLRVENGPAGGAVFTFTIPLEPVVEGERLDFQI
jgi:PAS domain S-box-containing protein